VNYPAIAYQRLVNQRIVQSTLERPGQVVSWLGAVQAQDYLGSLWAIGLRMSNATEGDVEQAIADRAIIRTWPLRGTIHFVAAEDVRWMLQLVTPRVVARSARRFRELELDEATFGRAGELLVGALQGGKRLSRSAVYVVLDRAGISTEGQRGIHILWRLAQDGVICFAAREGKQQTFALLEDWAPEAKALEHHEALAELARRYFVSHGPATLQDFAWWSSLPASEARAGLEMAKSGLSHEVIEGLTYWLSPPAAAASHTGHTACLLPPFDEYIVSYKDRRAVLDSAHATKVAYGGMLAPTVVVDGKIVGTWKRVFQRDAVVVTPSYFSELGETEARAVAAAAERYGRFLNMPLFRP
jgi:hypothetical protein